VARKGESFPGSKALHSVKLDSFLGLGRAGGQRRPYFMPGGTMDKQAERALQLNHLKFKR